MGSFSYEASGAGGIWYGSQGHCSITDCSICTRSSLVGGWSLLCYPECHQQEKDFVDLCTSPRFDVALVFMCAEILQPRCSPRPPSLPLSLPFFFLLSSFMCVPRVPATFLQIFIPGVKRSWSLSPVYSPVLSLGRLSQWPFFVLTESDREEGIESQRGQRGSKWSEVRMKRVRRKITVKRERKQWVHTAFVFCFLWKLNKRKSCFWTLVIIFTVIWEFVELFS